MRPVISALGASGSGIQCVGFAWISHSQGAGKAPVYLRKCIVGASDQFPEVVGQLVERTWYTMNLAQQVIEQIALSQLSKDVDVLLAKVVGIVGMHLEFIVNGDDFKGLVGQHVVDDDGQFSQVLGAQGTDIVMGKMWDDNHISHTTTLVLLNIVDNLVVFDIHPCPSIISWIQQAFQQLHLDQASNMLNHFTVIVTTPLDTSQNICIAAVGNICHERSTCRCTRILIELMRERSMIKFIDFDTSTVLFHYLDLDIKAIRQLPAMEQGTRLP